MVYESSTTTTELTHSLDASSNEESEYQAANRGVPQKVGGGSFTNGAEGETVFNTDEGRLVSDAVKTFDKFASEFGRKEAGLETDSVSVICSIMKIAEKAEKDADYLTELTKNFTLKKRANASYALFVVNGLNKISDKKLPKTTLNDLAKEIRGMQAAKVSAEPTAMSEWRKKPEAVGSDGVELTGRAKAFAYAEIRQPKDKAALTREENAKKQKQKAFESYMSSKAAIDSDGLTNSQTFKDLGNGYALQLVKVADGSPTIIDAAIIDQDKIQEIVLKNIVLNKSSKS